jgi:hypothetical protein
MSENRPLIIKNLSQFTEWYGITETDVRAAVESPDRDQIVAAGGGNNPLQCALYVKHLVRVRPPRSLLVLARRTKAGDEFHGALLFPANAVPDNASPLDALAALCDKYGTMVTIAGMQRKLIYEQTFSLADEKGLAIKVKRPAGTEGTEPVVSPAYLYRDYKDTGMRQVALAFAIHVDRLAADLRGGPPQAP